MYNTVQCCHHSEIILQTWVASTIVLQQWNIITKLHAMQGLQHPAKWLYFNCTR
jgi:hypothetical protein